MGVWIARIDQNGFAGENGEMVAKWVSVVPD